MFAKGLQNITYFYMSKMLGLHAADEHSSLDVSQFTFGSDLRRDFVRFQDRPFKNNQGCLKTSGKVALRY
jgi:hypothetical protein